MSGAFDWSSEGKGVSKGKEGKLPRHIERMDAGLRGPEMKKSVSDTKSSGLPWGGEPAEKKKAFASGPPKNKGSVTEALGQRTSAVGKLPHEANAAHCGHTMQIKSKSVSMAKGKKAK
jgi:hypothetical protein